MLIAMMGNTYHQVIKTSTKEYRKLVNWIILIKIFKYNTK